jgi:integration host factor subunit alpha
MSGMLKKVERRATTRVELADAIYKAVGLSRSEAGNLLEQALEEMSEAILRGEDVKISGFGNFVVRCKKERVGRNPKTGVETTISARKVVMFKASNVLKLRVNGDNDVNGGWGLCAALAV